MADRDEDTDTDTEAGSEAGSGTGKLDEDTDPSAIARVLEQTRGILPSRVAPEDLDRELAVGALVVDIRPAANRDEEGSLPGAVVIERIHLEWRLDPTSPHRIPEAERGRRVIVVCNEGYASSLAAASLQQLGIEDATDLAGGFRAWRAVRER